MRTVYILWLRQLKRYYRSRSRVLGSLGQPLLFLIALGFGFGPIYQKAGGGNFIEFLAPGIIAMSIIFMSVFFGIEIIWDRQFGFLKEVLVAPVSRFEIMIGRTLGGATVSIVQGLIVLMISLAIGFRITSISMLPLALMYMVLIALIFTAFGTMIASFLNDMHSFPVIMNFIVMPIFFLSGAIFPLAGLPRAFAVVVSLDPLSYGVDGLRGALVGVSHYGLALDFGVLSAATIVLVALGGYFFSKIQV